MPAVVVSFTAIRGFFMRTLVIALAIGVPAAMLAFTLSNRSAPVYRAQATLLAPLAQAQVELPGEVPLASEPMMPAAYGPVLQSRRLLEDAFGRLTGPDGPAATPHELAEFARSISFQFDDRKRSTLIMVGAEGRTAQSASARANAVAAALVAWDDARARANANLGVQAAESQIAALEAQLQQLRASGSRANLPQIASLSVLEANLRQDAAVARAGAVSSRGNLEFLVPAAQAVQVEPSPLIDAAVTFALVAIGVMVFLLVRAGLDRRVRGVAGMAEVAGLPVLADLTSEATTSSWSARMRSGLRPRRPQNRELNFLKAHLDRVLGGGAEVLVAGLTDNAAAARVATALDKLYSSPGSLTSVRAGPWLLGSGDALERAADADAVLIVADPRTTDRTDLRRAVAWLRRTPANVVGLVAVSGQNRGGKVGG